MPAKIKTEGKYVHEDLKEPQSSQTTQNKTVNSEPKNGKKDKLVESGNLMSLDELMKDNGYCEECGN
jgi:ribonucleoside-diphosphate reductase alpha chain